MAQTNINIRMDSNLKRQFEEFCSSIGMTMTTAICVFAKQAIRDHKIPFEIRSDSDPFYNSSNIKRLEKSVNQLENNDGTIHEVNLDD